MLQKLAWVFGVIFIVIGLLGLVPSFAVGGLLFGTFSVNTMFSAVYIISGLLAMAAAWRGGHSTQLYFKVFGVLYAIATVAGFLQGDTVLGVMTTNTADNVLNLVLAAVALWAGFGAASNAAPQEA